MGKGGVTEYMMGRFDVKRYVACEKGMLGIMKGYRCKELVTVS